MATNTPARSRAVSPARRTTAWSCAPSSPASKRSRPRPTITIYADSLYAIGAFTGNKIKKNADLISAGLLKIEAIKAMGGTVTFQHVNGHAGDPLNERCDKLARQQTAIMKGS